MQLSDFSFNLPKSLISFYPYFIRRTCRFLVACGRTRILSHTRFFNVIDEINPGDLIVLNNTKVIPARVFGYKENGVKIEVLVEKILDLNKILVEIKNSKNINVRTNILFGYRNRINSSIIDYKHSFFAILFHSDVYSAIDIINDIGAISLPSYIKRFTSKLDVDLYQTVYKKNIGSVATPTAGLYFDLPLLDILYDKSIDIDYIALHIGSGTFQLVRTSKIEEHIMHTESIEVSSLVIKKIKSCKKRWTYYCSRY